MSRENSLRVISAEWLLARNTTFNKSVQQSTYAPYSPLSFPLAADEHATVPSLMHVAAVVLPRPPSTVHFRFVALISIQREHAQDLLCHAEDSEECQTLLAALDPAYKAVELLSEKKKMDFKKFIEFSSKSHLKLGLIRAHPFPLPLFFLH